MNDQTPTYREGDRVIVHPDATLWNGDTPLREWNPRGWPGSGPWETTVCSDGPDEDGDVWVRNPQGYGTTWVSARFLTPADSTPPADSAHVVATLSLPIDAGALQFLTTGLEAAYGGGLVLRSSSAPWTGAMVLEVVIPGAGQ